MNLGFNLSDAMDREFQSLCYPEPTASHAAIPTSEEGVELEEDVWRRLVMRGPY